MTEQPPFSIADHGSRFTVVLFDDYDWVLKVPKDKRAQERIGTIVEAQQYLSDRVDGILPAYEKYECLVMPTAPGVRVDKLSNDEQQMAKKSFENVRKRCEELGWYIRGSHPANYFWNEKEKQSYPIDFSHVDRVE